MSGFPGRRELTRRRAIAAERDARRRDSPVRLHCAAAAILRVIRTLVKQRVDSIEQFQAAGRSELVEKETAELGAQGPKDMGRVMQAALERLGAGADGKLVSQLAKQLLAGG